jgi:hypothetical protein
MDEPTTTKPARSPLRARPWRRRRHELPERPHVTHRIASHAVTQRDVRGTEQPAPQLAGGGDGSRGRGPDDDGGGRKPDRNDGDAGHLLIALGILAVGAGVMSARLLAKSGRSSRIS